MPDGNALSAGLLDKGLGDHLGDVIQMDSGSKLTGFIMKSSYASCNRIVTITEESSTAFNACNMPPAKHTRSPARIS